MAADVHTNFTLKKIISGLSFLKGQDK